MQRTTFRTLAPRTNVEIGDMAFRIYRENFVECAGLIMLMIVPLQIAAVVISDNFLDKIILFLIFALNLTLTNALIAYITSERILGNEIGIGTAFAGVSRRFRPLVLGLITIGMPVIGVSYMINSADSTIFAYCGVPTISYFGLVLIPYVVPVFILENTGVWLGLKRTLALGRASFISTMALLLIIILILWVLFSIFWILAVLGLALAYPNPSPAVADTLYIFVSEAVLLLALPVLPIALTLKYYDNRIRIEGLDILMSLRSDEGLHLSDIPSPVLSARLLTRQDFKNIARLVLLVVGLGVGFYAIGIVLALLLRGIGGP